MDARPLTEGWVNRGLVRLHYVDNEGDDVTATPLMIIPGFASVAEDFEEIATSLAPRRCVAVSLRGRGKSDTPSTGYSLREHAEDIASLADGIGLTKLCLMAHSRGVPYAIEFARTHKEVVQGLILLDYPAHHSKIQPGWAESFLASEFGKAAVPDRVRSETAKGVQEDSDAVSLWDALDEFGFPVLVIRGGTEGSLLKDEDAAMYAKHLKDVRIVVFEESGHDQWKPDLARFIRTVGEFLTDTDDRRLEEEASGMTLKGNERSARLQETNDRTYEDKEYWNKLRKSRDYYEEEHVTLEGKGGEVEFDKEIQDATGNKEVLDIGCGVGLFTLEIARRAKSVVGVDFSEEAIARARKNQVATGRRKNVRFEQADAGNLPFRDGTFDVVFSRRGPATSSRKTLAEAHRVLGRNGILMEICIGEKDKQNLARIFGRGQMHDVKEAVAISKRRMLEEAGFREIEIVDYLSTEIFKAMRDLIIRLNSAPIIPDFDVEKDKRFLAIVGRTCVTSRGVETPMHRVTIVAKR